MLSRFAVSGFSQLTVYYTTVNLSLGLPHPVTTCSHAAGCRLVRYILPGPFCIDMLLTLSHRTQDSVIANFRPHPIINLKSIDMVPRVPLLTLLVRPNYINKWPVVAKSRLLAFHTCPCLFSINSTRRHSFCIIRGMSSARINPGLYSYSGARFLGSITWGTIVIIWRRWETDQLTRGSPESPAGGLIDLKLRSPFLSKVIHCSPIWSQSLRFL